MNIRKLVKTAIKKLTPKYIAFLILFAIFIFFRFYELEARMQFTWDQVENSWMMKNMIVDHFLPIEGMVAKGNSGIHIGPAYYYLLVPFYYLTNLDPIASGIFAGVTSILAFITYFYIIYRIFSYPVALISVAIYTFSFNLNIYDRIAWPVLFVPIASILIFYFLYLSVVKGARYLVYLSTITGLSFHFHFTSIYYPLIIICTLPLLVNKKGILKYIFLALPLFLIWFIPNILVMMQEYSSGANALNYLTSSYHGFHLVRFKQLIYDAFIAYNTVLSIPAIKSLTLLILPLFSWIYSKSKTDGNTKIVIGLIWLWFLVPWIVMTSFNGEISNYYFNSTLPMVLITLGYLTYFMIKRNNLLKIGIVSFWVYFAITNVDKFNSYNYFPLPKVRNRVHNAVTTGKTMEFIPGDPDVYLYYLETRK